MKERNNFKKGKGNNLELHHQNKMILVLLNLTQILGVESPPWKSRANINKVKKIKRLDLCKKLRNAKSTLA